MRQEEVRGAAGRPCVGEELAPLEIEVTRTLIVAGAVASRDYQDVHHDAELAREKGSPDIFMNILTTNGLVGRFVTDRFGPSAVLRKVAIRLGAPNYPGDLMVLTGTVVAVSGTADSTGGTEIAAAEAAEVEIVEVEVVGTNGLGRHVSGRVTVALPAAGPSVEAVA
ncbi:acyl dehydratase [Streptomyces sp. NPDC057136]|uniref:acyl dehydratase n=1 Tax=Streptomyces sp. NPDC057136 TaxID=3346029 RepID=UPI0036318BCE